MRSLLTRASVALIIILLSIAAMLARERLVRDQLQRDSSQLALETTLELFRDHDPAPLREHAHPELAEQRSFEFRRDRLRRLREHGSVATIIAVNGGIETSSFLRPAAGATAEYLIELDFVEGTADVEVSLVHREGRWQIRRHQIHSSLLAL